MKNKIILLLLMSIIFLPKINIINIPGFSTGIRLEDILISILMILFLKEFLSLKHKKTEIKKISMFFGIYMFCCALSLISGYISGYISVFS